MAERAMRTVHGAEPHGVVRPSHAGPTGSPPQFHLLDIYPAYYYSVRFFAVHVPGRDCGEKMRRMPVLEMDA
jgi:hypothetical protein